MIPASEVIAVLNAAADLLNALSLGKRVRPAFKHDMAVACGAMAERLEREPVAAPVRPNGGGGTS